MRGQALSIVLVVAAVGLAACEHLGVFEPFREVSCLQRAKVSLKDAVAAAETGGGRTPDADYRQHEELGCLRNNPGVYDVTVFAGGMISVVSVDAASGHVGPQEQAGVMNAIFHEGEHFEGSPADMARMIPRLSLNTSQAIGVAEAQGGRAMSAWIEAKDGKPGYTVKVVEGGKVRVMWVDGSQSL